MKHGKSPTPLAWPGLIGKRRLIFFGYFYWSLTTILEHYAPFWIFFGGRNSRLEARAHRLAKQPSP